MLSGETEELRIEDPAVEKAEFVVTIGSRRELHQAKRSHPTGKWTIHELWARGVLAAADEQLAGNDDRFVFVSSSDAPELRDLCNAARDAESDEEFLQNFLKAARRKQAFERLLAWWECDESSARDRLRRIEVRVIDERGLIEKVKWGVQALFLGKPAPIVAELRAIDEDSVHQKWTRGSLFRTLEARGYLRRSLPVPESAGAAVEAATDQFLSLARRRLIQEKLVPNEAARTLLSNLVGPATDQVLTGGAGSGKTACVVEFVDAVREQGFPILALRLDRVPWSSITTTTELGRHLGLEESPVLVLAAVAEARGRPGVLVVDQLDVVSTMSGRNSSAFDLVESLLQEARVLRARGVIHAVVVCRAFDWENDSRLRQLVPPNSGAQVGVAEFTPADVKGILASSRFDPTLLVQRQVELLRLPQNLSLFLEAEFDLSGAPVFDTAKTLFDQYWETKRRSVADQVPNVQEQWLEVIRVLCDEMTATQQLSVSKETLDCFSPDYLARMASEGVLTFDGRRYGFGHESFFDYCFARLFVTGSQSSVSFLTGSEQHVFRRGQVRQVLAYLRDADRVRYVGELIELLSEDGIRLHLKELAFALLAGVTDPGEDEWAVWDLWLPPALKALQEGAPNANPVSELAWRKFFGSPSWFGFAEQRGVVARWLGSGNDRLADMAVTYLGVHHRNAPDRVAALLEPYTDRGGQWPARLRSFMQRATFQASRRLFDLFLRLVNDGTLDEARGPSAENTSFWSMIYTPSRSGPELNPEALAHGLRRRLSIIQATGDNPGRREFLGHDPYLASMAVESAAKVPALWVEHLLPVVLEISDAALGGDAPPRRDAVWRFRIKSDHPRGEDACLDALAHALGALARKGKVDLSDTVVDLRRRDTYTANILLLALYAGGCERYANEATALFCDEPWRFECGYSDNLRWCAIEAIQAIFPHCSRDMRERLESVILGYSPPFERSKNGYRWSGNAQFSLLSAIPVELRSARVSARVAELERKFGEPEGEPRGSLGGWIGPPIESHGIDRMTDDDWLRAIAKYSGEFPAHSTFPDFKGGAPELAQALAGRVREEPDRFARLSLRFPSDANPVYLGMTLTALKDASVETDVKLGVCRKAFADAPGGCGRNIADLLGSIGAPLPDDAVEMLHWLMTEHDDPAAELWRENAPTDGKYHHGNISDFGLNSTRGGVAIAITGLIRRDAGYIDRFQRTLERMVRDPSPAVLSWVAETLQVVAFHDSVLGMRLFLNFDVADVRLLATRHVRDFIRERLGDSFSDLRPVLERMLRSSELEVCEVGARLVSLAHLLGQDAAHLVEEGLQGDPHQRLGVAQVAAANVANSECRRWSLKTLPALFNDDCAEVRSEASSCFQQLKDEPLDMYVDLIVAFCDSRASQEDSYWLLQLLEDSLSRLPGMICRVCEQLLDRLTEGTPDIRTGRVDFHTLANLVFRTYQQHQNDEWTSAALDLIDRLCLERPVDAAPHLAEFER